MENVWNTPAEVDERNPLRLTSAQMEDWAAASMSYLATAASSTEISSLDPAESGFRDVRDIIFE